MKRITRDRKLTPEEAAKYREVRQQIAEELPDLIARHHERLAARDALAAILQQLREAREQQGLSLTQLATLTGLDQSTLTILETEQRPNPPLDTLVRYAEAVGKRLQVSLTNA